VEGNQSAKGGIGVVEDLATPFLSAFKRDVMKNADATDARLIAEGNELAHYGNASADAGLYIPSGGRDFGVYEYLYGLDPGIVQRIGESMVIPYNNPNSP
jgi:hypothetical protein